MATTSTTRARLFMMVSIVSLILSIIAVSYLCKSKPKFCIPLTMVLIFTIGALYWSYVGNGDRLWRLLHIEIKNYVIKSVYENLLMVASNLTPERLNFWFPILFVCLSLQSCVFTWNVRPSTSLRLLDPYVSQIWNWESKAKSFAVKIASFFVVFFIRVLRNWIDSQTPPDPTPPTTPDPTPPTPPEETLEILIDPPPTTTPPRTAEVDDRIEFPFIQNVNPFSAAAPPRTRGVERKIGSATLRKRKRFVHGHPKKKRKFGFATLKKRKRFVYGDEKKHPKKKRRLI